MNVLIIRNTLNYSKVEDNIKIYFERSGASVFFSDRVDAFNEEYMLKIMGIVKQNSINVMLSVGFIEQYSLLCGVINLPYVSWILESRDASSYSYALSNEWNILYTANPVIFHLLNDLELKCTFLPLSYEMTVDYSEKNASTDALEDVLLWTEGVTDDLSVNEVRNDLKDSSKGYIDATLQARRADLYIGSICAELPEYVTSDLEERIEYNQTSYFGFREYCDYSMFYPILDRMSSYVYFFFIMCERVVDKLFFAMDRNLPYTNKELIRVDKAEMIKNNYSELDRYRIVIYFSEFADGGMITQDLWNIMAKGVFVLVSANTDLSVMGNGAPETFKNIRDLERKLYLYLNDEKARKKMADKVKNKVRELGTYEKRIEDIFRDLEKLNNK